MQDTNIEPGVQSSAPVEPPASAPAAAPAPAHGLEKYLTPLAVLVGAIIIAFALMYGHPAAPSQNQGQAPQAVQVNIKDVKTAGEPFLGNPDAPTTIAFFYDYQCPFCKQFEQSVTPQLLKNYVDTGKTKIVLKDFQFLGKDSTAGALFGRALWHVNPAAFPAWYKAMFDAQDQEGDVGFGNLASIQKLAATIPGIDVPAVMADLNANTAKYQAAIDADRQEGAALGVTGTPTVIVGTQAVTGLSPAAYTQAISAALDKLLKK